MLRNKIIAALPACAVVVGLATPVAARAEVIQLGFILDSSGSIGSSDWNIIRTGLANAVANLVPANGTYEISVVTFSTNATTNVNHILIDNAATRASVVNTIANIAYQGGTTNYTAAFQNMRLALTSSGNFSAAGKSYVNFATDGDPNPDSANGLAERLLMINAGIDNISIEGIGVTSSTATNLKDNYCYPGPCDDALPFNFPTQGFYIGVANAQGYADAIGNKIQVITQVPEPATLALFGMGLLGLGIARRRMAA